jgi:hypothetical protein
MAISYIESNWDTLYSELIDWNTEYGTVLNSEITTAWENCLAAAQRYGSYVSALNSIDADIEAASSTSTSSVSGTTTTVAKTSTNTGYTTEDTLHAIIKSMYENAQNWFSASDAEKQRLSNANQSLATRLQSECGVSAVRGSDGVWYVDGGKTALFDKYRKYIYHTGGIVGDDPTLKQNEVMAVLEKGEAVLDEKREEGLYRLVDFASVLSEKLGKVIDGSGLSTLTGLSQLTPALATGTPEGLVENKTQSVAFGDVYIYGGNDETVAKHQEVNRQFVNEVLGQLGIRK